MGSRSSPPKDNQTEDYISITQNPYKIEKKKNNRKSQDSEMAEQAIHSPKEGFFRRKTNYRPFYSQLLHIYTSLQNVKSSGSQTSSPKRLVDMLNRPQGRIQPCPSGEIKETLPRLQMEERELAVPSDAFWHFGSASHLHQSHSTCRKGNGRCRDMVFTISRRSAHHISHTRRMPTEDTTSSTNPGISGLATKLGEVTSKTCPTIRVVRSKVRSTVSHSNGPPSQIEVNAGSLERNSHSRKHHRENSSAVTRPLQLDRSTRPNGSTCDVKNKGNNKEIQEEEPGCSSQTEQWNEAQHMSMDYRNTNSTEAGSPISRPDNPDGCFTNRMGVCSEQLSLLREIRQVNEVQYQHPRTIDNMVLPPDNNRSPDCNSHSLRQHFSNSSNQEGIITGSSPISLDGPHLEESNISPMDTVNSTHPRQLQYLGRPTQQAVGNSNRMVPIKERFSENPQSEQTIGSRSLCHIPEPSTTNLHITMSRQESSGSRCIIDPLGSMETSILIPPNKVDPTSPIQDNLNALRECSADNPGNANQTVVYGFETSQCSFSSIRSPPSTSSGGQTGIQPSEFKASRLDVIKEAYKRRFPDCEDAIELMAQPLRENSSRDYQQKWQRFLTFLKDENISPKQVSLATALRFLTYLFKNKGLRPSTVAHYRSALSVPLKTFNVDLRTTEVSELIRSMYLKRPNTPVSEPKWNLNKVLTYIENLPEPLSPQLLLRKSAFLLLLATGWRISELHACVRQETFCNFSKGSLRLRPHPSFLAKNECPRKRWSHQTIHPLRHHNGAASKLCPVSALKDYLHSSQRGKAGTLFQPIVKEAKPLTKTQLSGHICRLIRAADPGWPVKTHDIRKYATSCALAETMCISDLIETIGWSGPKVFFKHYLSATEPLVVEASLPVSDPQLQH